MSKTEFKLPKMGESITEGTIINWIVQPGESFEEGDIIVEVGTDKVDNEVPAPFSGTLIETKYNAKDVVKIGEVIAILKASEGASKKAVKNNKEEELKTAPTPKEANKVAPKQSGTVLSTYQVPANRTNKFYSPLVEKIAREHHISYEELARIPARQRRSFAKKRCV